MFEMIWTATSVLPVPGGPTTCTSTNSQSVWVWSVQTASQCGYDLNSDVSLACARRSHHLHQYKQPVSVGMICTNNQLVWVWSIQPVSVGMIWTATSVLPVPDGPTTCSRTMNSKSVIKQISRFRQCIIAENPRYTISTNTEQINMYPVDVWHSWYCSETYGLRGQSCMQAQHMHTELQLLKFSSSSV